MKIKGLLVSITAVTLTALTIIATQTGKVLPSFNKVLASSGKSFTFDQGVGKTYWASDIDDEKTIAPTEDRSAISARTNIVTWDNTHGFGVQNDCFYWTDHPVNEEGHDLKTTLAVGVNNLQSFSFSFHLLPGVDNQESTSYRATVRFFGENYNVNKCIEEPKSGDELYEGEFSSNTVENDHHYTHTWTKPDQNHVIRYALFEIKIFSKAVASGGGYCALFLDSITVTWNC